VPVYHTGRPGAGTGKTRIRYCPSSIKCVDCPLSSVPLGASLIFLTHSIDEAAKTVDHGGTVKRLAPVKEALTGELLKLAEEASNRKAKL
jgi:hypothetical protein